MKIILFLLITSGLLSCQSITQDVISDKQSATPVEVLDVDATSSSTLIKTMTIQSTRQEGPRYEYRYTYDINNRLTKVDFWGYIHKSTDYSVTSYSNFVHRIATLEYANSGELSALQMTAYNQQGEPQNTLNFPIKKENGSLVIYGQPQWYPNPFASEPILSITPTKRFGQLALPWNANPNVQFALNRLSYDSAGNVEGIKLSHVDDQLNPQQSNVLLSVKHSQQVLNPFNQDPAFGAAHFVVRGGLDYYQATWLDVSQYMVLSSSVNVFTMRENSPAFSQLGELKTSYELTYNGHHLPVSMKQEHEMRTLGAAPSVSAYTVNFTY